MNLSPIHSLFSSTEKHSPIELPFASPILPIHSTSISASKSKAVTPTSKPELSPPANSAYQRFLNAMVKQGEIQDGLSLRRSEKLDLNIEATKKLEEENWAVFKKQAEAQASESKWTMAKDLATLFLSFFSLVGTSSSDASPIVKAGLVACSLINLSYLALQKTDNWKPVVNAIPINEELKKKMGGILPTFLFTSSIVLNLFKGVPQPEHLEGLLNTAVQMFGGFSSINALKASNENLQHEATMLEMSFKSKGLQRAIQEIVQGIREIFDQLLRTVQEASQIIKLNKYAIQSIQQPV